MNQYDIDYLAKALIFAGQISFISFIWVNTNAFYDYLKFFKIKFLFKSYEKYVTTVGNINYSNFLYIKNPNFVTKLFSCPLCFSFFICCASSPFHNVNILMMGFLSYFLYKRIL